MPLDLLKRSELARGLTNAEEDANKTALELFINAILAGTAGYEPAKALNSTKLNGVTTTPAVGGGASTLPMLDASGNLLIGVPSGVFNVIKKVGLSEAGVVAAIWSNLNGGIGFYAINTGGENAANCGLSLGKNTITNRSINAGGTINAGGADYSEYERKSLDCGNIAKGQIVGFDSGGAITDKWNNAVSFGVKTTNPSYVGGDTWGSEEIIGKRPEQPVRIPDTTDVEWQTKESQYASELAPFEAKLEAERQKVDRIAYSGKVPCNVSGASVGDYIIAVQVGEGIEGMAVSAPTFDQYLKCIGRVRRILDDGRPEIAVIVH